MTTYYVATRSLYVLLDSTDEANARKLGRPALAALFYERLGRKVPVEVHTVRTATPDEIETMNWHNAMVAREAS